MPQIIEDGTFSFISNMAGYKLLLPNSHL